MWSVLLIWLAFHRSWQKHGATHGKTVLFSVKQGVGGGGSLGLDLLHGQVWLCSGLALLSDESANAPAVRRRGSNVHRARTVPHSTPVAPPQLKRPRQPAADHIALLLFVQPNVSPLPTAILLWNR